MEKSRLRNSCVLISSVLILLLLFFFLNSSTEKAESPFSGDNGVKLWQAASVPFSGNVLVRAMPVGIPESDFHPPLTIASLGHLRGVYSKSFAWITGTFSFGSSLLARLLVLLMTLLAIPVLNGLTRSGTAGLTAFAVSGLVSYSLVFWEHGPAVFLFLLAVLLLLRQLDGLTGFPWWILPLLLSCTWRPENLVVFSGLIIICLVTGRREIGFRQVIMSAAVLILIASVLIILLPGKFISTHLAENLPEFSSGFLRSRLEIFSSWFVSTTSFMALAGFILVAVSFFWKFAGSYDSRKRSFPAVAGYLGFLIIAYYFARGSLGEKSLLSLCPGLVLMAVLVRFKMDFTSRFLILSGIAGGILVFLLSPTDGMFQFGPRFLLVPSALVASGLLRTLHSEGWPSLKKPVGIVSALLLLVMTGVAITRAIAFQEYFRNRHSIVSEVLKTLPEPVIIATDEPWLPVVVWNVAMERPVLYMEQADQTRALQGQPLVWVSTITEFGIFRNQPGYRGLFLSTDDESIPLPQIHGPVEAEPFRFAI